MALKLPRLQRTVPLVDQNGFPTLAFHQWWDEVARNLETTVTAVETNVTAIQAALDAAAAANAAAETAQAAAETANTAASDAATAATNAQDAADATAAEASLVNSYVDGVTLTGSDAGASASIAITSHTRVYGDGTSVSVNSGNLTGLSYSTLYYVYYVDAARTGGAVSYQATTSQTTAAQTGDTHLVGSVTTPAAAAPSTTGKYLDRKSTRLNSSHIQKSRMPSSA